MNNRFLHAIGLALGLAVSAAQAQVTLNDFSAYVKTDQTYFAGDWAGTEDTAPLTSFVQQSGSFDFTGGTNSNQSSTTFYFSAGGDPFDLTGITALAFTAQMLPGNSASSFRITLFGSNDATALAWADFATTDFSTSTYSTVTAALIGPESFDLTQAYAFQISGSMAGGSDLLNFSADNLAAVGGSAVPEPSTYAAFAGLAALAVAAYRRHRCAA